MAQDLTQGKIGKTLLVFAAPIVAGMLLQTAFNLVDTFFIGMLGPLELAAISLTFPIFFVFIAISSGLGIGANALISQAVGEKNLKAANNFAEHAIILAVIFGIATGALGIIFAPALFALMGADKQVLEYSMQYAVPIFAGVVFTFLWFVSDAILRAQGNSRTPMVNLAIAVALNAVLDPFFIFGIGPFPRWGLFGAAIVTVFADMLSALLNFRYIYSKNSKINLSLKAFKPNLACMKSMISIGLPASISQALSAAGFTILIGLVGTFGSYAIAAYGIGMRITSVIILPIVGIESAVASFVGQNVGAKSFSRAKQVGWFAAKASLALSILLAAITILFPEQIVRVFTKDASVISMGKNYLSIVSFAYIFYGFYFPFSGAFQGTGKTMLVLATNIAYWAVAVGIAAMLSKTMGLQGIWIGITAAAALELIAVTAIFKSGIWLKPGKKKQTAKCD